MMGQATRTKKVDYIFTLSWTSTLKLKEGDRIDLIYMAKGKLFDDHDHYTHFTGWIIEEDLEETYLYNNLNIYYKQMF